MFKEMIDLGIGPDRNSQAIAVIGVAHPTDKDLAPLELLVERPDLSIAPPAPNEVCLTRRHVEAEASECVGEALARGDDIASGLAKIVLVFECGGCGGQA